MKKRLLAVTLAFCMIITVMPIFASADTDSAGVAAASTTRQMEELDRGLFTAKTDEGVYITWRLLGTESLSDQAFDIYKNGTLLKTTGSHDPTNYIDKDGTGSDAYQVVRTGESKDSCPASTPLNSNHTARGSLVTGGTSEKNSFTYFDIPIERPDDVTRADGKTSHYHNTTTSDGSVDKEGGANDASVGDLDGDGDYEIILKWDPTDSKDSAGSDYTGYTYFDAYDYTINADGSISSKKLWRINLGVNVTSGQHYSPFMVYDFDGDGMAEFAVKTAPGSTDASGKYVTEAGDTEEIRNADNSHVYVTEGSQQGKNTTGPEYLTIFGSDGNALYTTDYIPRGNLSDWGDSKANRSERYLAGVAYLDGVHPSLIMCRGYYAKAVVRAYDWDGETLSLRWEHNGNKNDTSTLYGQGNHNLSAADIDNDGKDEIVYGSAALDDDGTIMGNTRLGHGDAMHVSDFNNDGVQEVFSVKEDSVGYKNNAAHFRVASTGQTIWGKGAAGDTGRGVMDNIDDAYAKNNPNALALAWSSSHANAFDLNGAELKARPATSSRTMTNFLVYWDGDLGREILDDNQLAKYHADTGYTTRFYDDRNGYIPGTSNNYTKHTPSLVADILGDWREEIILPTGKGENETPFLRVFVSTLPSDYRLTTLMHDSQYRCAIAWQNTAYNQPPHQSYYIGSAALAKDADGSELNYLAPKVPFTSVVYPNENSIPVTGLTLSESQVRVERGTTYALIASVEPKDASKKGVTWASDNPEVATVSGGVITGVSNGSAKITATAKDTKNGTFTQTCEVTVYTTPVEGLSIPYESTTVFTDGSKKITASVEPENATDKLIHWSSSDSAVATVDSGSNVKGQGVGSAIITAKSNDGGFEKDIIVTATGGESSDATGSNSFENVKDADNLGPNKARINQENAVEGGETYKDFEIFNDNKVTLKMNISTGGQKLGSDWGWDGNEYTFGISFLGVEGNNLLTLSQSYQSKAQMTQSTVMAEMTQNADSDWTEVSSSNNGIFGRSSTTWHLSLEFDYDNDVCNATIYGNEDDSGNRSEYSKTFELNGNRFKTVKLYTAKDGEGGITARPSISDLIYTRSIAASGDGSSLYEKGTTPDTAWQESDIDDWTVTGNVKPVVDPENGGILFNPTKPSSSYSAEKNFNIQEGAIVTYNTDWYFKASTSRASNREYIQFGSGLRIACAQDGGSYYTYVSSNAGTTWDDMDSDGSPDNIFTGSNNTFTKNITLVVDTSTNTILKFMFDNTELSAYKNHKLPEDTTFDKISFGFSRGGSTGQWEYFNGLSDLTVLQFVPETINQPIPSPEPSATATTIPTLPSSKPSATAAPTEKPTASPTVAPTAEATSAPTPTSEPATTSAPTVEPTATAAPTSEPSATEAPTTTPTSPTPTSEPTATSTPEPTATTAATSAPVWPPVEPTATAAATPTTEPTPTASATAAPSEPSPDPTTTATATPPEPTVEPTATATATPTMPPGNEPTATAMTEPTATATTTPTLPTVEPTAAATSAPTEPTVGPVATATPVVPTAEPAATATATPAVPTAEPTATATATPAVPTAEPAATATATPTVPTAEPAATATAAPTQTPGAEYAYTINNVVLLGDENTKGVDVTITKNFETDGRERIIIAAYGSDKLVMKAITSREITADLGEAGHISIPIDYGDGDIVIAYIWNGFDGIKPLAIPFQTK